MKKKKEKMREKKKTERKKETKTDNTGILAEVS